MRDQNQASLICDNKSDMNLIPAKRRTAGMFPANASPVRLASYELIGMLGFSFALKCKFHSAHPQKGFGKLLFNHGSSGLHPSTPPSGGRDGVAPGLQLDANVPLFVPSFLFPIVSTYAYTV